MLALRRLATLRSVGSTLWAPHPDNTPQQLALASLADELLYGGSAGGGKTDLLCGTALTSHRKSRIYRKYMKDTKAIKDRIREILGDHGSWSGERQAYTTNDGRDIEIDHCSKPGSEMSAMGRARDLLCFDELAHFTEHEYVFISTWNRSADPKQRCRIIGASNPPLTAEGAWLIRRWAPWLDRTHPNPAAPGELRWFATLNGKDTEVAGPEPFEYVDKDGETELVTPRSRTFIPAKLEDNPYYAKGPYRAILQALPEPQRSALLKGYFGAAMIDDAWQVIPTAWIEAAQDRWKPEKPAGIKMSAAGVDVALGGLAQTVIAPRYGNWFDELIAIPGAETDTGVKAAGRVMMVLRDGAPAHVDAIGVGVACLEHLVEMGVPCKAMDAREKTTDQDRAGVLGFYNRRAQWWWQMREALDPEKGDNLALPPDSELRADLAAPRWTPSPSGVKVEPKEDIEERLGRSVDKGDAVVMALPDLVAEEKRPGRARRPRITHRLGGGPRWGPGARR